MDLDKQSLLRTETAGKFIALFLILFSAFFALSGGLQALFFNPNAGASRPHAELTFIYPRDLNNQGPGIFTDVLSSVLGAALATFFFLGVFWAVRWGVAEARTR